MRYLILCGALLAAIPACAYNEALSAISYNPSRMGAYTHLKVAQTATLGGGLKVLNTTAGLNFRSVSGIELDDSANTRSCADATCATVNEITEIKPEGFNASDQCDTAHGRTCATSVVAQKVLVQKNATSPVESYSYSGDEPAEANRLAALSVYGGTMQVGETVNADSYINTLANDNTNGTVSYLLMKAGGLQVDGNLFIVENFQLGNITIDKITNPQSYAFVERRAIGSENTYRKVRVLAVRQ